MTTTEGQVWNRHPGPGTRPPPGLARPRPLSSAPPHYPDAQRLLGYRGPLRRRGLMTYPLLPGPGASLQPEPGQWGVPAGCPGASARRGGGWALPGVGPDLASRGATLCPAVAARRPWERGGSKVGWGWRKRPCSLCVAGGFKAPDPSLLGAGVAKARFLYVSRPGRQPSTLVLKGSPGSCLTHDPAVLFLPA